MAETLPNDDSTFPADIDMPVGGELASAGGLRDMTVQPLNDRTNYLKRVHEELGDEVDDLETLVDDKTAFVKIEGPVAGDPDVVGTITVPVWAKYANVILQQAGHGGGASGALHGTPSLSQRGGGGGGACGERIPVRWTAAEMGATLAYSIGDPGAAGVAAGVASLDPAGTATTLTANSVGHGSSVAE